MSYCALSDVQGVLVNIQLTANSKVPSTQVTDEIIPLYDRYIDDRLGRYYVTPITGSNSLLTMITVEKLLVAAEVADRVYLSQAPSNSPQAQNFRSRAETMLTQIINGDIILTDATPTQETPESRARFVSDKLSNSLYGERPKFNDWMRF